jgi:hypothetical protein
MMRDPLCASLSKTGICSLVGNPLRNPDWLDNQARMNIETPAQVPHTANNCERHCLIDVIETSAAAVAKSQKLNSLHDLYAI